MKNLKTPNLAVILLLLSFKTIAGTNAFIGPSSDSACDFDSIQAAIDSGETDLFISNAMQYNENLTIPATNSNVFLRGGYASCSFSSLDPDSKSTVSGHLEDAPVLIITASTESKFITLSNMNIVNGTGAGFIPAGGINMIASNDRLSLSNTTVGLNEGFIGGGIYIGTIEGTPIDEKPYLTISDNSLIINNSSSSETLGGGGVFCENGYVIIRSNSSIKRNITEGSGGGIYSDGCILSEWSGSPGVNDAEQGIFDNQAKIHGGGVYARNTSTVQLGTAGGSSILYGSVINNIADSDNNGIGEGGGIYAATVNASVLLYGSILKGNRSGGNGGGIYAADW